MGKEQPQPHQEASRPLSHPGPQHSPEGRLQDSPDFITLLRHYSEAMLRIGKLEAKLKQQTERPQDSVQHDNHGAGPALAQEPQTLIDLERRLEELQKLVKESAERSASNTDEDIASGSSQAQGVNEEQLREVQGHQRRRRRQRDAPRPWWKKLAQSMNLSK